MASNRRNEEDRQRRWRSEEDQGQEDWSPYGRPYDDRRSRDMGWSRGSGTNQGYGYYERDQGPDYSEGPNRRQMPGPNREQIYYQGPYGRAGYNRPEYDRGHDWESDYNDESDFEDEPYTVTYTEYWLIPGPFRGMGPEGYQRSDERIKEDVCERLTQHGQLDARRLKVDVKDSEVTLEGMVPDRRSKRMAEDAAESVMGVSDVHNRIRVDAGQGRSTDSGRSTDLGRGAESGSMMTDTGLGRSTDLGQMTGSRQEDMEATRPQMGQHMGGQMSGSQGGPQDMQSHLHENMHVMGRDGEDVGTIKKVRQNDFLVDRAMARDVFIPFHACRIEGDHVMLNVPASEVDDQNWPSPDLIETPDIGREHHDQ